MYDETTYHESRDAGRRLVLLTRDGPEHRYVANRICLELGASVAAIIVDVAAPERSRRRLLRHGYRRALSRVLLHGYWRLTGSASARAAAMHRVLGAELLQGFVAQPRVVPVHGINSDEALRAIRRAGPDALVVYGTAIVSDRILSEAREIALNMHTGISPDYRGCDCAFWPIVNCEPEMLGATVHECTSAVDGGPIFGTSRASCEPDDGLGEVFARAVRAGTELYVDVLRRYLRGELSGRPQDLARGREYRSHTRTVGAELVARRNLRRGLLAGDDSAEERRPRRPAPRRRTGVTVVLYHHLTGAPCQFVDRLGLSTPPELFEAHIEHFARRYDFVDLEQVLSGRLPRRPMLITFDDGYRSVADRAAPVLRKHGIPSVFFLSGAMVGGHSVPPDNLVCYLSHRYPLAEIERSILPGPPRSASVRQLVGRFAELPYRARVGLAATLTERFQLDRRALREESGLFLDPEDVKALVGAGMEIGNHSRSHIHCRSLQDTEAAEAELTEYKRQLERWSGRPVRAFSYPYGDPRDATPFVEQALVESGHEALFLVGARLNAVGHAGPRWYRTSIQRQPVARLNRHVRTLPRLRVVRDSAQPLRARLASRAPH